MAILNRLYNKVYQDYLSKAVPFKELDPATENERKLIDKLRAEISLIPEAPTEGVAPSTKAWNEWMNNFKKLVLTRDPREFLQWDVIIGTMFTKSEPYINHEFKQLNRHKDSKWQKAIAENNFGQPTRYYRFNKSSGNLVHHVYHLAKFEESTKVAPETMDIVVEFGGGYGSMCRLFQNLGFKGKYVIFDLPAFSALQKYYLKSLGFTILDTETFASAAGGILCISDRQQLEELLKNYGAGRKKAMFIATWSFSETSLSLRREFEDVFKHFSYFLLAYQHQFRDINNQQYFKELEAKYPNLSWEHNPISHMKVHSYLIGNMKQG